MKVTVDIVDLEVTMATMALVLVTVAEEVMVVVEGQVVDMVVVVKDRVTKKGEMMAVTMVVVGIIMMWEIMVDDSNQIMDP